MGWHRIKEGENYEEMWTIMLNSKGIFLFFSISLAHIYFIITMFSSCNKKMR